MIIDTTFGHLDEVKAFAERVGKAESLQKNLEYLGTYACNDGRQTRCRLFRDFAPMSFFFRMELKQEHEPDDAYRFWFVGGLIYHGPHDNGGDGGAPTFSVSITPQDGWSIHT